jgi:ABC-2 type transport system permease protein
VNNKITPAEFFAPAVVILLLQHLAVTFASLAIVREHSSGSIELFRVSPLGSFEILIGKYLSYLIIGGILAAVITATIVLGLKVPMQGSWRDYALVLSVLLFTSLGLGFVISLVAKTEMQAVQYAMFLLLGSVFFSGFFLDLRYLLEPVRSISWALPATYGIRMLQDTALRGAPINALLLFALLGIGLALLTISWFLLRRRLQLSV